MAGVFFCVVFLVVGGFLLFCRGVPIWQVICSMMTRSLVFSKASLTLGAGIVLSV